MLLPLRAILDLIDTLWNVKFFLDLMVLGDRLDLIDTLWNVKSGNTFTGQALGF